MVCGNTTKNKPTYDCNICGRTFNRSNNLKRHLRGHAQRETVSVRLLWKAFADKWYWTPTQADAYGGAGPERRGTSVRSVRQGAQEQKQSHQTHGDTHRDKEEHMHLLW